LSNSGQSSIFQKSHNRDPRAII